MVKTVRYYTRGKKQMAQITFVDRGQTRTVHAQAAGKLPNGNTLWQTREAANKGRAPEFVL